MSQFVRASKFRHVFAENPKIEHSWVGMRLATTTGEQSYIKASGKYFALATAGGGGPFSVYDLAHPGRVKEQGNQVLGHSSAVLDFDWNPFDDCMIASASDDSTVKVWQIPEDGMKDNITEPVVDLRGHGRKVMLCKWNPTVNMALASCSSDQAVKLWDVSRGSEMWTFNGNPELTNDLAWDHNGNLLATSCKDKHVRVIDGRTGTTASDFEAHEGSKSTKVVYLGASGHLASVGFTKQSQRELKIWDPRKNNTCLKKMDIDQAAGVILPFFDVDTNVLYLCGKGDGNVRYYEISHDDPFCYGLSEFRSTVSCKGACTVPKRANNILGCETMKILKLTVTDGVQPLSFIVPRKSDAFQEDIFPDSAAPVAAHGVDEWLAGSDKVPVTMSLDPAKAGAAHGGPAKPSMTRQTSVKSVSSLSKENDEMAKRIAYLETKLSEAGISF